MSGPHRVALLNQLKNVVIIVHEDFFEASNLYHSIFIFLQLQDRMVVKQVVELAAVNFIH